VEESSMQLPQEQQEEGCSVQDVDEEEV